MPTVLTVTGTLPNPFSLGKVIPGATFATACVPLTQNLTPVMPDKVTPDRYFNEILITAFGGSGPTASPLPSNTGFIYICSSASAPDLVNFTNVLAILAPNDTYPREGDWSNNKDIQGFFVGADNATDYAIATAGRF